MKFKRGVFLTIVLFFVIFCGWLFLTESGHNNSRINDRDRDDYETYIGGICVCPPYKGQKLEVVKLYKSKGDSLEKVKQEASHADCSNLGCAVSKEYRLYP